MTTISNHLNSRVGDGMCRAIAAILNACPDTWYAPIGPADGTLSQRLDAAGAPPRYRLLGWRPSPSDDIRPMHLYLNEFPVGGGVALIDAMAAGLPIVALYDPDGPHQARYIADYYDPRRAVRTPYEYVELAESLLTDPARRAEWATYSRTRFGDVVDLAAYARRFERLVGDAHRHPPSPHCRPSRPLDPEAPRPGRYAGVDAT